MKDLSLSENELIVLGGILDDPTGKVFNRVKAIVSPEDFFDKGLSSLYATILDLEIVEGIRATPVTVSNVNQLFSQTELEEMAHYYGNQWDVVANVGYAKQLKQTANFRYLLKKVEDWQKRLVKGDDITKDIQEAYGNVMSGTAYDDLQDASSAVDSYLEALDRPRSPFIFSGIKEIDVNIFDLDRGHITIIAGTSGFGKSAFVTQSAVKNLEAGNNVGLISIELSNEDVIDRIVANKTGLNIKSEKRKADPRKNPQISKALTWLKEDIGPKLQLSTFGSFDIESIERKARTMVANGAEILFIDYIGLIDAEGYNANERLTVISRVMKLIAVEMDIPIVVVSQMNRQVYNRAGGEPNLSDIRDSGAIVNDASIVAFLYSDLTEEETTAMSEVGVKLKIAKQRNGPQFYKNMSFIKTCGRFESLATY